MRWSWLSKVGTLTRHPCDRYPELCAWAYADYFIGGNTDAFFMELYNNDNAGRRLKIYSAIPGSETGGVCYLSIVKGPVGSASAQTVGDISYLTPVYPFAGALPGQVLRGHQAPSAPNLPILPPFLVGLNTFFPIILSPAPIVIVPVGYSAIVQQYQSSAAIECSLFYMVD